MRVKVIGATLAVIVLVVVGVGVAIYTDILPVPWGSAPPEHSARYYPDDVLAYTWLTLDPSMGQHEEMMDIWERFNEIRYFRDMVEDLEDGLDDETGLDLEDDVLPWVGAEISAAILDIDIDGEEVEIAVTIDVRDADAAAAFLDDWLKYLEDEHDADFDMVSINDYDVWVDEDSGQAYALTTDLLVFSITEGAMEDVLDRVAGEKSRTLASDEDFMEARASLPDRRFASFYVNYQRMYDVIGGDLYGYEWLPGPMGGPCIGQGFGTPDWITASAAWVDRGLVFNMVSPTVNGLWPDSPDVADTDDVLPGDTLAFLSMSFNPNADHWREALRECAMADLIPGWEDVVEEVNIAVPDLIEEANLLGQSPSGNIPELGYDSTLADALDFGLLIVDRITGIHPEEDLLDYLDGHLIIAVSDFDLEAVSSLPADNPINAIWMVSYGSDGEDGLKETMDDIVDLAKRQLDVDVDLVDVGADDDARIFGTGFLENTEYSPGFVLHDGYLSIGSTEKVLETIVARQKGDGDRLSSADEYRRAVGHLPSDKQFLMYVDLHRIIGKLDPDVMDDDQYYEVLADGISAMAMSSSVGDDYSRTTLVLTLLHED